jgi:TatA/E family protein of Tat protein translocase
MEFFGIGMGELLLLLILALIVVGPQKLPEIGRNLGNAINAFKTQTDALRSVMTFDPTTVLAADSTPSNTPPAPPDARVTALHDYLQTRAPAPVVESDETAAPPPPTRTDQEHAS